MGEGGAADGAARIVGLTADERQAMDRATAWDGSGIHRALGGSLAALLGRRLDRIALRLVLPDGTRLGSHPDPAAVLRLKAWRSLAPILVRPEEALPEAYVSGLLEVDGDLAGALEAVFARWPRTSPRRWARGNGARAASRNAEHHYDLGNDFFAAWLDEEMVYTCAYFETPEATLEQAQQAKMDYVCRKLRLRPGEHVVEAGCGWGALALHMARHRGVRVLACNVSGEQIRWARERARREGLSGQVEFVHDDYRSLRRPCDAFVSIGMLEHVGPGAYASLGGVIDRCLDRGHGRGLLHFIGRDRALPLSGWIRRHIFPGAYPPTLGEVLEGVLEPYGLSPLDAENLRLHYARTLEHWWDRYERAVPQVQSRYGDRFARMWRLYLVSALASFRTGWMQLFQLTFARGGSNDVGWTREALYRP